MEAELEGAVDVDILEVDETLTPLQAVLEYSRSEVEFQRHAYIKGIGPVASQLAAHADGDQKAGDDVDDPVGGIISLIELLSELLACVDLRHEDSQSVILGLEQVHVLGKAALSCLGADGNEHYHHLCQETFTILQDCVEGDGKVLEAGEQLASAAGNALAALLSAFPGTQAAEQLVRYAGALLRGYEPSGRAAAIKLLSHTARNVAVVNDDGHIDSIQRLQTEPVQHVMEEVLQLITGSDYDESVQQVALAHMPSLSLLLTHQQRGPHLIVPACQQLSTHSMWSVRAAVSAALPGCVALLSGLPAKRVLETCADVSTCKDPDVAVDSWSEYVRACVAASTTSTARDVDSVQQLVTLLTDVLGRDRSEWSRSAAIKAAGPVLCVAARVLPDSAPAALLDLYCECMGIRPQPPDVQCAAAACLSEAATLLAPPPLMPGHHTTSSSDVQSTHMKQHMDRQTVEEKVVNMYRGLLQFGCPAAVRCIVQQLPQLAAVVGADVSSQRLIQPLLEPDKSQDRQHQDKQAFVMMAVVPVLTQLLAALPAVTFQSLLNTVTGFVLGAELSAGAVPAAAAAGRSFPFGGRESSSGAAVERCGLWRSRLALAKQLQSLYASCESVQGGSSGTSDAAPSGGSCPPADDADNTDDAGNPAGIAANNYAHVLIDTTKALLKDPVYSVRTATAQQIGAYLHDMKARLVPGNPAGDHTVGGRFASQLLQTALSCTGVPADHVTSNHIQLSRSNLNLFACLCKTMIPDAADNTGVVVESGMHEDLVSKLQGLQLALSASGPVDDDAVSLAQQLSADLTNLL